MTKVINGTRSFFRMLSRRRKMTLSIYLHFSPWPIKRAEKNKRTLFSVYTCYTYCNMIYACLYASINVFFRIFFFSDCHKGVSLVERDFACAVARYRVEKFTRSRITPVEESECNFSLAVSKAI